MLCFKIQINSNIIDSSNLALPIFLTRLTASLTSKTLLSSTFFLFSIYLLLFFHKQPSNIKRLSRNNYSTKSTPMLLAVPATTLTAASSSKAFKSGKLYLSYLLSLSPCKLSNFHLIRFSRTALQIKSLLYKI